MVDTKREIDEVVRDLREKIDNITQAADSADDEARTKVEEIKNNAIKVLSSASYKIVDIYQTVANSEEVDNSINVVKNKSKELYENAMKKIDEIKGSKKYNDTIDYVKKTAYQVKDETRDFFEGTKNNIDEFFEKTEVKHSIDQAKLKTVDVAEKALDTLKQWLKPEDEDK